MTQTPHGTDAGSPTSEPSPEPASQRKPAWQPWAQPAPYDPDGRGSGSVFDYGFSNFQTPRLAKLIYILATIVAVLLWLSRGIMSLATGLVAHNVGATGASGEITIGILTLLLGWIPALLGLLLVRVFLEAALALIRGTETKITSDPES